MFRAIFLFFKSCVNFRLLPSFLFLGLIFFLIPGNNYYSNLVPKPQVPPIRPLDLKLPEPALMPLRKPNVQDPLINAKAAVIIDGRSAMPLYQKNPNLVLKPASTTKIMTALVTLDFYPLDRILTIRNADRSVGQTMDLVSGEQLTVENLLYGLLLHSGNDAAYALAENYPGGYQAFVLEMNHKASQFHLENTNFSNVSGIDQENHYTTVSDLARLAAEALKHPIFLSIVSTKKKVITDTHGVLVHDLVNKNELLGEVEGVRGIKTGWTEAAGECLVTDTLRENREIITVILGSPDRFRESQTLIEWAFSSHEWVKPN